MTSRPWMPFYIADYLADTAHLNATQSGGYLHLSMHYWQTGSLPDDDSALMRIARLTVPEWRRNRAIIAAFFHDGWRHKRIDAELSKAEETITKRSAAGKAAASARYANRKPIASQSHSASHANGMRSAPQSQLPRARASPSPSVSKDTAASAAPGDPEKDLFDRGKQVLGSSAGGQIVKLLKVKNGSVPMARAAIEQASTKQNPREFIGAIIRGVLPDDPDEARLLVGI